jgi:hypothetical protein
VPQRGAFVVRWEVEGGRWIGQRFWQKRGFEGRRKLEEVREEGRKKKGAAAARETGAAAILLAMKYPNGNGRDRDRRRLIHEALMREFVGALSVQLSDGTARPRADADHRAARAKILRRLQRAYRELGEPPELLPLI